MEARQGHYFWKNGDTRWDASREVRQGWKFLSALRGKAQRGRREACLQEVFPSMLAGKVSALPFLPSLNHLANGGATTL